MKRLTVLAALLFAARAYADDVRICEELKAGDVTALICPQTLNTLLWLAPLGGDNPGVMNLSVKTANPQTVGFRVTVSFYRSLDHAEVGTVIGFFDAGKVGEYSTIALLTGRIGGVKAIQVMEIQPALAILFGE